MDFGGVRRASAENSWKTTPQKKTTARTAFYLEMIIRPRELSTRQRPRWDIFRVAEFATTCLKFINSSGVNGGLDWGGRNISSANFAASPNEKIKAGGNLRRSGL